MPAIVSANKICCVAIVGGGRVRLPTRIGGGRSSLCCVFSASSLGREARYWEAKAAVGKENAANEFLGRFGRQSC